MRAVTREAGATIVIPSEDEWYKAAYYNGSTYYDYPTGTDTVPSNAYVDGGNNANFYNSGYTTSSPYLTDVGHFATSASPYGTFDQGGNVWEWNEALISGSFRGLRGGSFNNDSSRLASSNRYNDSPTDGSGIVGFRVATVPEPSTAVLAILGLAAVLLFRARKRARRRRRGQHDARALPGILEFRPSRHDSDRAGRQRG